MHASVHTPHDMRSDFPVTMANVFATVIETDECTRGENGMETE